MNLFFVGWNLPHELVERGVAALQEMTRVYTQLDISTLWRFGSENSVFTASIHHPQNIIAPREYVYKSNGQVTFYDGVLVDCRGGFQANQAEFLSANWDRLPERLEGHFAVVRANLQPASLEILTDVLGMKHVFYRRFGRGWMFSNSVRVLTLASGESRLDLKGASLWLSLGSIGSDLTLEEGTRVVPGGAHWRLDSNRIGPEPPFTIRQLVLPPDAASPPRESLFQSWHVICSRSSSSSKRTTGCRVVR